MGSKRLSPQHVFVPHYLLHYEFRFQDNQASPTASISGVHVTWLRQAPSNQGPVRLLLQGCRDLNLYLYSEGIVWRSGTEGHVQPCSVDLQRKTHTGIILGVWAVFTMLCVCVWECVGV